MTDLKVLKDVIWPFKSLAEVVRHTRQDRIRDIERTLDATSDLSERVRILNQKWGSMSGSESAYFAFYYNAHGDFEDRQVGERVQREEVGLS